MCQKTSVENADLLIVWKWKVRCGLQIATIDPLPLSGALESDLSDTKNSVQQGSGTEGNYKQKLFA
jgi:hypothetical protein